MEYRLTLVPLYSSERTHHTMTFHSIAEALKEGRAWLEYRRDITMALENEGQREQAWPLCVIVWRPRTGAVVTTIPNEIAYSAQPEEVYE